MVFLDMAPEKQNPAAGRDARLRGKRFYAAAPRAAAAAPYEAYSVSGACRLAATWYSTQPQ
jgi:hypothetical protein